MNPSDASLAALYGSVGPDQRTRYETLSTRFEKQFGHQTGIRFFSSPGRTEIGGNHTDHQSGRVLAAAISLDTIAAVAARNDKTVCICSEGFAPMTIDLTDLSINPSEADSTAAIVRGCAARMQELGYTIGGFDAVASSNVLVGSGLSSSAAFEVLICTIFDHLYNAGDMSPILRAQISQYAENTYFGKPSGLMDQMASSVGGIVAIDFADTEPEVTALNYNFEAKGYALAVVNTGGSHDNLTSAYAAIREEMEAVAALFGKERLRYVDPVAFERDLPSLRGKVSDRALLRTLHFIDENNRVPQMVAALEENDLDAFFRLVIGSGQSSWMLLQNVWALPTEQPLALALEESRRMLEGKGAWRVHGGGFAGTILAFVPLDMMDAYAARMDALYGNGATCRLNIRSVGPCELK